MSIPKWATEHEASTPDHLTPLLVHRRNREPWRVTLRLSDFLDLLGREPASDNTANRRSE